MHGICNILKYSNKVYFTYGSGTVTTKSKVFTYTPRRQMGALRIAPIIFNIGSRERSGVSFTPQPL